MEPVFHLANAFLASHPEDAARLLEDMAVDQARLVLMQCQVTVATELLQRTTVHWAAQQLQAIPLERSGQIVERLAPGRAAGILRRSHAESPQPVGGCVQLALDIFYTSHFGK